MFGTFFMFCTKIHTTPSLGHFLKTFCIPGLQGIDMANADNIENVIMNTFTEASETGFDSDRVQAILNQTELSLKKQKDDFGWRMIMNLTHGWNHVSNPLDLLTINPILDRFR